MTGTRGSASAAACALALSLSCGSEFTTADGEDGGSGDVGDDAASSDSSDGGQGGRDGSGGRATGSGGMAVGAGGAVAAGGTTASGGAGGGATSGGSGGIGAGGVTAAGGQSASGGAPAMECDPFELRCDEGKRCGQNGSWQTYECGPLKLASIERIEAEELEGFHVGFRCKSLTVCTTSQSCLYFDEYLGYVQSSENAFSVGPSRITPEPVIVVIDVGAASQCGNPTITLVGGSVVTLTASSERISVYFPAFTGKSLLLYVREDGATFYDEALTDLARAP